MNKLKLMTIVGTRPEIIKMSAIIKKCDMYFDHILVHTGQNYDYTLNEVFFKDLGLRAPNHYLGVVGENLGQTMVRLHPMKLLTLYAMYSFKSLITLRRPVA